MFKARLLFCVSLLGLIGCYGRRGGGGGGGGGDSFVDVLPEAEIIITGRIFDQARNPLAGVSIAAASGKVAKRGAGQVSALSDLDGKFTLAINAKNDRVYLTSSLAGFSDQISMIHRKAMVDEYTVNISLLVLSSVPSTPGQATSVDLPVFDHSIRVTLPADAMSQPVQLRVANVDAENAPGELRAEGEEQGMALQSAGMIYVDVVDMAGEPVMLPPSKPIEIEISPFTPDPIPDAEPMQAWQLNDQGAWADPSPVGNPQQPMAVRLAQFGFWNLDRNFRTACVKGKLASGAMPCPGARVQATGPDGISSFDNTSDDGSFCVTGAQTFSSMLSFGGTHRSVQMPNSAGDCGAPESCDDLGDVMVPGSSCEEAMQMNMCNTQQTAGADTPETRMIELGRTAGTFTFSYDTYLQQDRMVVTYEGATLFDTGCVGAGGTEQLTYSGTTSMITVSVSPNCAGGSGTAWEFTVTCPQ